MSAPETTKLVYEAGDLTKVYHMSEVSVEALWGVDIQLYESELIVLLGRSGSGKSALLNILSGLDDPSSREVFYRGDKMSCWSRRFRVIR
ncbi:MAG: ATP-binding cassette domain-containing protein [Verrucomicrobiales bacterium]|nr:ATP-binding cassette domain-containing protein [Verrucomicrobiales bacterium]